MPNRFITVINTGGTFNKTYNPLNGLMEVPENNQTIQSILRHYYGNIDFTLQSIIHKDSLAFTDDDRTLLAAQTAKVPTDDVIIIHGTDTMNQSAQWLESHPEGLASKRIIFVGSMYPYSIAPEEAVANFSLALGYLNADPKPGIYLAMHGLVLPHSALTKDTTLGKFVRKG